MRALLAAALLLGCSPELGPCDPSEARRVVYDDFGSPAFEGQALMIQSCGHGVFCHSSDIDLEDRHGVPLGLDFDLRIDDGEPGAVERLREMQRNTIAHRHAIWAQVSSGSMPATGPIGEEVLGAAPRYQRFDMAAGETHPFPTVDTDEGSESLRNWLACGSPVVERTEPLEEDQPIEPVGWVVQAAQVEPLEPNWLDIYTRLVEPRCATGPCHGREQEGGLDLRDRDASLARLTAGTASGDECIEGGARWIDIESPDDSLFLQKLTGLDAAGDPVCGERMPRGTRVDPRSIAAIRLWIMNGAAP
jgi:hypothetical protein